ncbi:MAG: cupin domain-containing protein [Alphaproteobacteria bacterium]|nr:cupin domain-containing protein [Alphaproteobacteria bacterium]
MKIHHAALAAGVALLASIAVAHAEGPYKKVEPVLAASETVIGEPLRLPDGSPLTVTATIVTIEPGEETAWHKHGVPLYVHILSGEVTVDYGEKGTRAFGPGGAFMEAMDHWHRGTNRGKEPVRILAVYMGSDKARNVIPRD